MTIALRCPACGFSLNFTDPLERPEACAGCLNRFSADRVEVVAFSSQAVVASASLLSGTVGHERQYEARVKSGATERVLRWGTAGAEAAVSFLPGEAAVILASQAGEAAPLSVAIANPSTGELCLLARPPLTPEGKAWRAAAWLAGGATLACWCYDAVGAGVVVGGVVLVAARVLVARAVRARRRKELGLTAGGPPGSDGIR